MISSNIPNDNSYYRYAFQSRNRGSFDFKDKKISFVQQPFLRFQSRNRGSFDFKLSLKKRGAQIRLCFNLVIEVLLISSQ